MLRGIVPRGGQIHPVLAESYTRAVDANGVGKGAIASFSPTGFGLVAGHDLLEEGFFLAVFHEGIDTLGAATTYAKQYLGITIHTAATKICWIPSC